MTDILDEKPFYLNKNSSSGSYSVIDELLHRELDVYPDGESLSETQYFGISIPEESIQGLFYCWWLPRLNIVCGGVAIYQGLKGELLASELIDWRYFMNDQVLKDDLTDYCLFPNLRSRTIEPGRRFRLDYHDHDRNNHIELELTALMDPFMFASNRHFEQTMKTRGSITLRGKLYAVDSYCVRDRSWGQLRPQTAQPMPPMSWTSGVFDDGFSFCCSAFDHPDLSPDWLDQFELAPEAVLSGGYVQKDGIVSPIRDCRKRTRRNPTSLFPEELEMSIVDSHGRRFEMRGEVIAGAPVQVWANVRVPVCLAKWSCDGLTGYGDIQDIQWTDYIQKNLN